MITGYNLIAIVGPTASNKTVFAAHLAYRIKGEVISADSRQVYRNMNLGTGKDYDDYLVNGFEIPYHLIDMVDPGYKYSVFEYQRDFFKTWQAIKQRENLPILCGGSGMYIDAVTRAYRLIKVPRNEVLRVELEPKSLEELSAILASMKHLHNFTDIDTREHVLRAIEIVTYHHQHPEITVDFPELNTLFIGIRFERPIERQRITERLYSRINEGMVEEVKMLMANGISAEDLMYYGLEYKYITLYLTGKLSYDEMTSELNTAIHQFAKRQMTWFRKMEREGIKINWINGALPLDEKLKMAEALINHQK